MTTTSFTTRIWYNSGTTYTWPEQLAGVTPTNGVCFSGGGSRSLTCTMGQLRALVSHGLIGSLDYISSVSGGSWAATAFTYYRAGAASDDAFLGTQQDPSQLTLGNLREPNGALGQTATTDLGDVLGSLLCKVPADQLWIHAVGQTFFAPFGLWDAAAPAYFSLDAASVQAIQTNNPSLADQTFYTVRQPAYKMPYLLVNATLGGPVASAPYEINPLVMVTYSPLYAGVPFNQTISYTPKQGGSVKASVGGGFIEPFAWGSGAPSSPASGGTVQVPAPAGVFGLADASGASSSAFAAAFAAYKKLDGLLPTDDYWPPTASGTQPPAIDTLFGDGGNIEGYGFLPLLQRGVKNIVVFMNTATPLSLDYVWSPSNPPTTSDVDSNLMQLFGYPTSAVPLTPGTANDQVFLKSDFGTVINALQAQKRAGNTVYAKSALTVQDNAWWGITGGGTVNVLWVYNDMVETWKSQLDWEIRAALDLGDVGPFAHFPNYKTVDEDQPDWSLTELTTSQINLLANLSAWNVLSNLSVFQGFLGVSGAGRAAR